MQETNRSHVHLRASLALTGKQERANYEARQRTTQAERTANGLSTVLSGVTLSDEGLQEEGLRFGAEIDSMAEPLVSGGLDNLSEAEETQSDDQLDLDGLSVHPSAGDGEMTVK